MRTHRGREYPDLRDVINFYKVDPAKGGFNKEERECPNLFVRLPNGVTLSVDVSRQEIFDSISKYGHIPEKLRQDAEAKIDEVCQSYIDNMLNGDIM